MNSLVKHTIIASVVLLAACGVNGQQSKKSQNQRELMPASDPNNEAGWVLNEQVSDEFEGKELDRAKWFIEGENEEYYIWKGRAPSQFVPHNVRVEKGKLKLRTAWEPDYDFFQESYTDGNMGTSKYGEYKGKPMPITTAGVVSKKRFLNGYMEIKSKVGDAAITGAFWAIGYEQELDVFEQMGNPKNKGNINERSSLATGHDWSPPAQRPTNVFQHVENLPYRVADEFHVYGAEWGVDYLTIFIDGKKVHHFTQDDVGLDWILNNPMEIWLDSEIFFWLGLPHKEELPVDFEIEYVRVWQKPTDNLLDRAFYGFEGPILFEDNPRPLLMVPESSEPNDYQQFWNIDSASAKYLSIVEGNYATGVNSLEFSGFGKGEKLETDIVVATSPEGALNVTEGEYILSFNLWLDQGRAVKNIYFAMQDANLEIPISIDGVSRREWVKVEKKISVSKGSSPMDQFKIQILNKDVPKIKATRFYIDDISIVPER